VGLYENPRRALCVGAQDNAIVHFQRLIAATGAYDRIPTVPGNDLPGIVGLRGFERVLPEAKPPAAWRMGFFGHRVEARRAINAAERVGITLQFLAGPDELPKFGGPVFANAQLLCITGRGRVRNIEIDRGGSIACDLLIVGFSQPSYELQAQNGCSIELRGSPPVVWPARGGRAPLIAVGEAAGWYMDEGTEERTRTQVFAWLDGEFVASDPCDQASRDTPTHDDAFVCFCEDVRVRDVRAAIAEGYCDVELVKRHTGAGTGPCQGKLCHGALLACAHSAGLDARIPTPRPLARPVPVAALAGTYQFPSQPPQ
jgi:bacterioferritin-associated ferredoxin